RRRILADRLAELDLPESDALRSVAKALIQIPDLEQSLTLHARISVLLLGATSEMDETAISRICPRSSVAIRDIFASLVAGQGERPEPPTDLGLAELVP